MAQRKLFGKYRGRVVDNQDPLGLARVKVAVPAAPEMGDAWALPCLPFGGIAETPVGFHAIPPVDALVWVEFEGGDASYPIWTGCFWEDRSDFPAPSEINPAEPAKVKMFRTEAAALVLDDTAGSGGATLEVRAPAVTEAVSLTLDDGGAKLSAGDGSIELSPGGGITLAVGDTRLAVSSAGVTVETGGTRLALTPEGATLEGSAITARSVKATTMKAGTELSLDAGSSATLRSSAGARVEAGATLDLVGTAKVAIKGGLIELN